MWHNVDTGKRWLLQFEGFTSMLVTDSLLFKPLIAILISFLELQFKMLSENESLAPATSWNSWFFP